MSPFPPQGCPRTLQSSKQVPGFMPTKITELTVAGPHFTVGRDTGWSIKTSHAFSKPFCPAPGRSTISTTLSSSKLSSTVNRAEEWPEKGAQNPTIHMLPWTLPLLTSPTFHQVKSHPVLHCKLK